MRTLEQEDNPEVLKLMAIWLRDELVKTRQEIEALRVEAEKKKQHRLLGIEDQLTILRRLVFGRGSEKRSEADARDRGTEEKDLLLHSQSILPPLKPRQVKKLDEESLYYEMTDEELKSESELRGIQAPSSDQWQRVEGFYDETSEVTVIERKYVKNLHRQQKYRLKPEFLPEGSDKASVIVTAQGPKKLLVGSTYSIDFATSVVADKYISHIPLERQTRAMESLGLKEMSTKTLYNLSMTVAVYLEPVAERIRLEILSESRLCVHADETPWPIQIKEQDDGQMWVVSNQVGSFYAFEPTRSGSVVDALLKNYKGPVMCDGYTGYNRLTKIEGVTLANCWAHARRKFFEIRENYPTECDEILDLIEKLHEIERRATDFNELKRLREEESKIIIDRIKNWLYKNQARARPETALLSAIDYTLKYWLGLTRFLNDTRVPLTNNEAERTIRHAVMGRKNFYGSRTHNGADVAATLYTIIESCKKVEVDPRSYINMAVKLSAAQLATPTPLEYAKQLRS